MRWMRRRSRGTLPFPMFVKPANLGSSVGISKAHNCEELKAALKLAAQYDRKVVVERGIEGREFECARAGQRRAGSVDAMRDPSVARVLRLRRQIPAEPGAHELPAESAPGRDSPKCGVWRWSATKLWDARAWDGWIFCARRRPAKLYINEINTIPGFTSISMYPKMWAYSGLPYPELIDRLIELALERHGVKKATRFTR